jgi:hypothetical protein
MAARKAAHHPSRPAGRQGNRAAPVTAAWGVRWAAGENHSSGTETGLTALAIEGATLDLFEPEEPDP